MVAATAREPSSVELTDTLMRVASCPSRAHTLHRILGPYCHQMRNLLNAVKLNLYLMRREGPPETESVWDDLTPRYEVIEQFFDRLQRLCRPTPTHIVRLPLELLFQDRVTAWSRLMEEHGRRLMLDPPKEETPGAFDPTRLGEAFDDLVSWRARAGDPTTDLRLRWAAHDGWFQVDWDEIEKADDAEGLDHVWDDRADQEASPLMSGPLDILTLPLLSKIMAEHRGIMECSGPGCWRLKLRWPLDASHPAARSVPAQA